MNVNKYNKPVIPTREEFHRSFSGYICAADFSTVRCIPGSHLNRIAGALRADQCMKQQTETQLRRKKEKENTYE